MEMHDEQQTIFVNDLLMPECANFNMEFDRIRMVQMIPKLRGNWSREQPE